MDKGLNTGDPGTMCVLTAKVPCLRRGSATTQPALRVPGGCSGRRESVARQHACSASF